MAWTTWCVAVVTLVTSACGDDATRLVDAATDNARDAADDARTDSGTDASRDADTNDATVTDADAHVDSGDAGPLISRVPGLVARPANPTCVAWDQETAPPALLSLTGCFDPAHPDQPLPGLIPFEPIAKLWSDHAEKHRWFAIPDGTTIIVNADGDFDMPNGTVLAKTFSLFGKKIETRLFVRHPDGVWRGYAYEWNNAETDATLLSDDDYLLNGKRLTNLGDTQQSWTIPSRTQCDRCHTEIAGHSLGLEVAQLNSTIRYAESGRDAHQLVTLNAIGLFDAAHGIAEPIEALPKLAAFTSGEPLASRARSYLHVNCSMCHRAGGQASCVGDLRFQTAENEMGLCNVSPLANPIWPDNVRLVKPGDPEHSVIALRMRAPAANDAIRMPPLATEVLDHQGTNIVEAWIRSLESCPQ